MKLFNVHSFLFVLFSITIFAIFINFQPFAAAHHGEKVGCRWGRRPGPNNGNQNGNNDNNNTTAGGQNTTNQG